MRFAGLVETLVALSNTSSRNLMTEILAECMSNLTGEEIDKAVYLLLGQLGPMFKRIDFGIADKMVVRAIGTAAGITNQVVQSQYKSLGDLGEVVYEVMPESGEGELGIEETFLRLTEIATTGGQGSQEQKIGLVAALLKRMTRMERKYAIRIILGKMRLGFSDKTILDALAVMDGGNKVGRDQLEQAYQIYPDIGEISKLTKQFGGKQINQHIQLKVGVPIMPALAQRLKTPDEMIKKMGEVIVEPKFDGTRIQIHVGETGEIKAFARSLEENSKMFPELALAKTQIKAKSIILDGEAVGYNRETGKILPFQETITRKRKYGVEARSQQIPIKFYCFDVLYKDGQSLLQKPLWLRRQILEESIEAGEVLVVDEAIRTSQVQELREYHAQQLRLGLEGALVKKYDGEYQPGRTGWNWVKFKEAESARGKLRDTVDGVVMGYYRGRGKRSGLGIGAFLLGVMDDKTQTVKTVAKIGTGLSDEQWKEMRQKVDNGFALERPNQYRVAESLAPDVWAEPTIVVEIAADELTKSPLHTSGYGLRFPRLVRFRDDKRGDQITTIDELVEIGQ